MHPSPYGQRVYANSITRMLDAAFAGPRAEPCSHAPSDTPLDARCYSRGRLEPVSAARPVRGFTLDPQWHPQDGLETREGFVDVPALIGAQPGDEFEYAFDGCAAGLFIVSGPDTGTIKYCVDEQPYQQMDTFTQWSPDLYLPWALMLADGLAPGSHTLRLRIAASHHPKSTGTALRVLHFLVS